MKPTVNRAGLFIAWSIISIWLCSTTILLFGGLEIPCFTIPFLILVQTHLYTGLFITAHDAMHGLVSDSKILNVWTGRIAAFLFAFNNYDRIFPKHHLHHKFVATGEDPDYHPGNFLYWYFRFLMQYINFWQIFAMAVTFNLLILFVPLYSVILFWMLPSLLSTLQLFFFGTYLPHRGPHDSIDSVKAKSQKKGHLLAFLSCYFFGYHREHHSKPQVPWWKLYLER